jgi:hypothetical protein
VEKAARVCRYFQKNGTCRSRDRCKFAHTAGTGTSTPRGSSKMRPPPPPRPTLLQRLLKNDIVREKSQLLQAIRFFVNNKCALSPRALSHTHHIPTMANHLTCCCFKCQMNTHQYGGACVR